MSVHPRECLCANRKCLPVCVHGHTHTHTEILTERNCCVLTLHIRAAAARSKESNPNLQHKRPKSKLAHFQLANAQSRLVHILQLCVSFAFQPLFTQEPTCRLPTSLLQSNGSRQDPGEATAVTYWEPRSRNEGLLKRTISYGRKY